MQRKQNRSRINKSNKDLRGGKRPAPRSKSQGYEKGDRMGEEEAYHKYNDVSWYAKNDNMLRDAASLSYNNPLGQKFKLKDIYKSGSMTVNGGETSVPGLMTFTYIPCIGVSKDSSSPANLAAQNIYSYVRYMNSGAKNYDQADLMLYLLAMDNIYMMWNWLKRMYGYLRTYSIYNKYMPRAYATAETLNFDDAIANLADFRMQLNSLAAQISSFCVPAVMPLFVRHSWMASNIYADSANQKAQQYMYIPRCYYTYEETASQFGGKLQYHAILYSETVLHTYSDYCGFLKSMIDKVAYSEDIGVMSGDILKAYGQEKLFKISPIEPDYMVAPVYNEEVLNQLHNSTHIMQLTSADADSTLDVTQDPNSGFLIWNPQFNRDEITQVKAILNMPWDDVTPANTMVATRLTTLITNGTNGKSALSSCGSEVLDDVRMFYMTESGKISSFSLGYPIILGSTSGDSLATISEKIAMLTNFDWHPLTPIGVELTSGSTKYWDMKGILGDFSNYTFIDEYTLSMMHQTALLSEFNVPQIGSF